MDAFFRAFNTDNGEMLWQTMLPAGGQATPMTYELNGKQYVVIAAGGHGKLGTKLRLHCNALVIISVQRVSLSLLHAMLPNKKPRQFAGANLLLKRLNMSFYLFTKFPLVERPLICQPPGPPLINRIAGMEVIP